MVAQARILRCETSSISFPSDAALVSHNDTLRALKEAALQLQEQQVVVFPTETVYGLGANALNATAVSRIFSTKGRPADNPLIVHVSSLEMLRSILPSNYIMPKTYKTLTDRFWPGALTLLFPADQTKIPSIVTANRPTVGVRMPSHPVARALISISGTPLAAPSANSSTKPSPTRAEHVLNDLGAKVDIILDAGLCDIGVESTVVDGLQDDGHLRILRPGGVTVEDIEQALINEGLSSHKVLVYRRDYRDAELEQAPTTPGMKYRHYSPSVPVFLYTTNLAPIPENSLKTTKLQLINSLRTSLDIPDRPLKLGLMAPLDSNLTTFASPNLEIHSFPLGTKADPRVSAARLFDGLLSLEKEGVDVILVEELDEANEGLAFMNRIRKAAKGSYWITDVDSCA